MATMDEDFPPSAFLGFAPDALAFFEELAEKQDKAWFAANKARYETAVLTPLSALVAAVSDRLAQEGVPLRGDPKRAIFRINRDVRFSNNKAPYKTHAGAVLTRDGAKHAMGMLYIHLDPTGSFAGSGFYNPAPSSLQAMRAWMADNPTRWSNVEAALAAHDLVLSREQALSRAPRGFEAAPAEVAEALKLKSWVVRRDLSRTMLADAGLVERLVELACEAEPLLRSGWSAMDRRPGPGV